MNKIKKFIIRNSAFVIVFILLIMPIVSSAVQDPSLLGLVTCQEKCDFNDLMILINKIINFILFKMVIPIAAIMFAYAGFQMITAGGAPAARTKAKDIFFNAVLGLIIAVAAFLIIRTILSILGYQGSWIGFNLLSSR